MALSDEQKRMRDVAEGYWAGLKLNSPEALQEWKERQYIPNEVGIELVDAELAEQHDGARTEQLRTHAASLCAEQIYHVTSKNIPWCIKHMCDLPGGMFTPTKFLQVDGVYHENLEQLSRYLIMAFNPRGKEEWHDAARELAGELMCRYKEKLDAAFISGDLNSVSLASQQLRSTLPESLHRLMSYESFLLESELLEAEFNKSEQPTTAVDGASIHQVTTKLIQDIARGTGTSGRSPD